MSILDCLLVSTLACSTLQLPLLFFFLELATATLQLNIFNPRCYGYVASLRVEMGPPGKATGPSSVMVGDGRSTHYVVQRYFLKMFAGRR